MRHAGDGKCDTKEGQRGSDSSPAVETDDLRGRLSAVDAMNAALDAARPIAAARGPFRSRRMQGDDGLDPASCVVITDRYGFPDQV